MQQDDQQQPTDQLDQPDALEVEDQALPDEETAELGHIENDREAAEADAELDKVLEAIVAPLGDDDSDDDSDEAADQSVAKKSLKPGKTGKPLAQPSAPGPDAVKKGGSHTVSQELIDRPLSSDDWIDDNLL